MGHKPQLVNLGLPKTGTKSFIEAMEILGFNGLHIWKSAEIDKSLYYRTLRSYARPLQFLRDYDALADTPFYAMRSFFEENFKSARLMFTTRDKDGWVESMVLHRNAGGEFLRDMYQMPQFPYNGHSKSELSDLFEQHHSEVCRDLPGIHLESMSDVEKWEALCKMLPESRKLLRKVSRQPWPNLN